MYWKTETKTEKQKQQKTENRKKERKKIEKSYDTVTWAKRGCVKDKLCVTDKFISKKWREKKLQKKAGKTFAFFFFFFVFFFFA